MRDHSGAFHREQPLALPDLDDRLFATSARDRGNIAASVAVGVVLVLIGRYTDNLDLLVWGFYGGALADALDTSEELPLADIEAVELQCGEAYHRLTARLRDGSTRTLLPGITSATEAETLHARLQAHVQSRR